MNTSFRRFAALHGTHILLSCTFVTLACESGTGDCRGPARKLCLPFFLLRLFHPFPMPTHEPLPMSNGLPRSEPSPVAPTPAFAAHLDRFRRSTSSPTSSRTLPAPALPSPLTAPELTQSGHDSAGLACSSAALPQSPSAPPPLPRSTATPPRRSNGTSSPHFKRKSIEDADPNLEDAATTPTKKKKRPARPYAHPSQYAELGDDPLPDYLEEGLDVLLCGINPGVKSAQMRLHCKLATTRLDPAAMLTPRLHFQMRAQRTTSGSVSRAPASRTACSIRPKDRRYLLSVSDLPTWSSVHLQRCASHVCPNLTTEF